MILPLAHRAIVAFGANLGDREATIRSGLDALDAMPGVKRVAVSPVYASDPVGVTDQPEFLNGVAAFDTAATPEVFLRMLHAVEREHGRVRDIPNGPRTLDLDLLFYDGETKLDSPSPTLPHPRWRERPFVTAPLADLLSTPPVADDPRWAGVRAALVPLDKSTGVRRLP